MSERIINGGFDGGTTDPWINGPGRREAYDLDHQKIRAISFITPKLIFHIEQEFVVNSEVVSALCSVWAGWESRLNGYVRHIVIIKKPSLEEVEIYNITKAGKTGDSNILLDQDISAHLDEYGNYKLILICALSAGDPPVYDAYGWWDNASINIAMKKKKTVVEGRGGGELQKMGPQKIALENRGMSESKSTRILRGIQDILATLGRTEIIGRKVKKTVMEALGRAGVLFQSLFMKTVTEICGRIESYTAVRKGPGSATEGVGRTEAMTVKKTAGNVETTYAFIGDTEWDEISGVTTHWIKTKSEILGG